MIIAYSSFYMFASFTSELPWSKCDNYWNNDNATIGPVCTNTRQLSYCTTTDLTAWLGGDAARQMFEPRRNLSFVIEQTFNRSCANFNLDTFTCGTDNNDPMTTDPPLL